MDPRARERIEVWLPRAIVVLLCVATLIAKVHVNEARTGVGHGDTGYYVSVAKNLAAGRGFVVDYVADFLARPTGIPAPANTFWMPLTPVVLALGMVCFGASFAVAQGTMIAITSLAPILAYLLGREFFGKKRYGLFAACLTAVSEGYLTAACQPQTHGLVLLLGGTWLLLVARAMRDERWLSWLGPVMGLLHLNRSDGTFYFVALVLVWLFPLHGRRWSRRGWGRVLAGYALVMAPFWVHSTISTGSPLPGGAWRTILVTQYPEIYSLPESLTLERYLDSGSEAILASKRKAFETNGLTLLFGAATGTRRTTWNTLRAHHYALLPLVWLGWIVMLRRRFLPLWALVGTSWFLFTFVMSVTGLASFRAMLFAVYPVYFAAAGRTLDVGFTWIFARVPKAFALGAGAALTLPLLVWLAYAQVRNSALGTQRGARFIERIERRDQLLIKRLVEPHGLGDALIMALDVHELHAHTGLKLVTIPHEPEPVIHAVARELGVTHVLLFGEVELYGAERPGLAAIPSALEHYELIDQTWFQKESLRLYRVLL